MVSFASGSWWTWTITSSSTTPTKIPSSSTSRATRMPTRSHWRRSDSSVSRPEGRQAEMKETLWLVIGWNLRGCYRLADKLTDNPGDISLVASLWRCHSPTLLHYEAFPVQEDRDINKKRNWNKWTFQFLWTGYIYSSSMLWGEMTVQICLSTPLVLNIFVV